MLLLSLVAGCSGREAGALERVESLMDARPDSAMSLLDSITPPPGGELRARYALLYSQALDKNYIDVTDDSLITVAEDYYAKSADHRRLMLSYFYHGRVLFNKEAYTRSLLLFNKSLKLASELGDDFWCGRSADEIYTIYDKFYYSSDALHYAKMAHDHMKKSGRQPFLNYAILDLGRAYYDNGQYKESLPFIHQAIDSGIKYNDKNLTFCAKKLRIYAEHLLDWNKEAIRIVEELLSENWDADLLALLGTLYVEENYEQQYIKINLDTVCELTPNIISFNARRAKRIHDYETALHFTEMLMEKNNEALEYSLDQGFNVGLSDYFEYEDRIKDLELASIRTSRNIIISLIGVLIVVLISIFYVIYRRHNKIIERNIGIAHNLREILSLKEAEFVQVQESIRSLFSSRFSVVDSLCASYYENKATKSVKRKISDEVERLISDMMSKEKIDEFEQMLNKNGSGIMSSFRQELPDLKEADYRLFIYSALGFSNTAIALFLDEDKLEPVYNRKARLKAKIKKINSPRKEIYLMYLSPRINS